MRNAIFLIRIMILASLMLALPMGVAEAKKKKSAPVSECGQDEYSHECNETFLQTQGVKPDDTESDVAVVATAPAAEAAAPAIQTSSVVPKSSSVAPEETDTIPEVSEPAALVPPEPVPEPEAQSQIASADPAAATEEIDTSEWYIGTMPDQPYDIPLVDRSKMDPKFERQEVSYNGKEPVGSVVVDIDGRFLYFIESEGRAIRYGIGVGRLGFSWRGTATVGRKGVWPHWTPTTTMRKVLPNLPAGMEGGVDSPLGARAMYLYQGGRDTLFRIHGTNEPWSIGEQVSSGCVRLLNEDVADLYERVKVGAQVYVRNSKHGTGMKNQPDDISG